jgi:hypothetical protein
MTLPNFLVIGAQRSGTTWLDKQLRYHPSIYLPTVRKEVHFFDRYYDRGLDWYKKFFPSQKQAHQYSWIGEVTPDYLFYPEVPELIKKHLPHCKFILILRNPVDRLYSQYGHAIRTRNYSQSFDDFIQNKKIFKRSLYGQQLNRYLQYFPLENFLILIFEETMKQPDMTLSKIANFLDINSNFFGDFDTNLKVNRSYKPRFKNLYSLTRKCSCWLRQKDLDWVLNYASSLGLSKGIFGAGTSIAKLDDETRNALICRYEADIAELEHILARDLSIWRR